MNGREGLRDLYELLGVTRDASAAEITRAWHRQARMLHPDAQPGQAGESEGFQELAAAYRVLGDAALRAAYDRTLRPAPPVPAAPWPAAPRWPVRPPPGAVLWAGPVQFSPSFPAAGADARLAALAVLLARRLDSVPQDWPW